MEKNRINILCTPDDNYIPYCGIMLTSLFENNRDININLYVISCQLSEENQKKIRLLCNKYCARLHFIPVSNDFFKNCPIRENDHVSIAAYYRLIAPSILPHDLDKILYFDCDTIINASIFNLYNEDLTNYAIGAVKDEAFYCDSKYERLCYDKTYSYINSGVVLFNLDYWRKNNITDKCFTFIAKHPERILFHDQDTINGVLYNQIKLLPIEYNLQTGFLYSCLSQNLQNEMEDIRIATKRTVVIHYTGKNKPWIKGEKHPYRKHFLYYKEISLWKNYSLKKRIKPRGFKEFVKEILQALGIIKEKEIFIIKQ